MHVRRDRFWAGKIGSGPGAFTDKRDRHRMGAHAVARDAAGGVGGVAERLLIREIPRLTVSTRSLAHKGRYNVGHDPPHYQSSRDGQTDPSPIFTSNHFIETPSS